MNARRIFIAHGMDDEPLVDSVRRWLKHLEWRSAEANDSASWTAEGEDARKMINRENSKGRQFDSPGVGSCGEAPVGQLGNWHGRRARSAHTGARRRKDRREASRGFGKDNSSNSDRSLGRPSSHKPVLSCPLDGVKAAHAVYASAWRCRG